MICFYYATHFFTKELRAEILYGYKTIEFKTIDEKYDFIDKRDRFSTEFKKFVIISVGQKYMVTEDQLVKLKYMINMKIT